ncbi:PR domain zinc finger protein 1 [Biomphalaria glabrata]|nr:PR domain zinc finger protein 1 [Biomphalaria glabrata]
MPKMLFIIEMTSLTAKLLISLDCTGCSACSFHCPRYKSHHHHPDSIDHSYVIYGDPNFCHLSLPTALAFKKSTIPEVGIGVFAQRFIPAGTLFGPLIGVSSQLQDNVGDFHYTYQVFRRGRFLYKLNCSDQRRSNWMRFVKRARHECESTAIACECWGDIYYKTTSDLYEDQELLIISATKDLKIPVNGDFEEMSHVENLKIQSKNNVENTNKENSIENLNAWQLQIVRRKSGKSAGLCDVYYISPTKKRLRSTNELLKYVTLKKLHLDISKFIFSKTILKAKGYFENPTKWPPIDYQ